ncbi:hypothetical protein ABH930_003827 [Kitasatospora sp. GAS204A]|uniref:hypothetical protein n=1 Tax=unclassified Kitasatospora TaxID=2633591 RepID=UPI002474E82F|nr:hypothetical protein [Kitasatospora sp. GAS204B]MDH6120552.1 hypothetical protein [Kitasatospora sp. GAS204B]
MQSSTPVTRKAPEPAERVPMDRLLAATAAAVAVCTPPKPGEAAQPTTCTRVPSGAKSQSV